MNDLLITNRSLSESEMKSAMMAIMNGECLSEDIEVFLTEMASRGETVDEITGAARILRQKAKTINAPDDAIDCCGTGGDGVGTYNISTAVAIIAAACGIPIAKHGNRSASSKSGAADVLEALNINLEVSHERLESALDKLNFCFLMAPHHHSAMKHVVPVRKKLGFRTIFNLLGPLANPAGTKNQLIGVFDKKWLEPIAQTLARLGSEQAWIVHGSDGLDEITSTDETDVVRLKDDNIDQFKLTPELLGLEKADTKELLGGDAKTNAKALMELLEGSPSAYRNIVLANTAAVINIHNQMDLKEAVNIAAKAIDEGRALEILNQYRECVA